jgi:hypothetical protein
MKLNTDGVTISILILIFMILICHTMNYLYPRKRMPQTIKLNHKLNNKLNNLIKNNKNNINSINTFTNTANDIDYNKIYYHNQNEKKLCDANLDKQANVPCDIIKKCSDDEEIDEEIDEYTLSDSELAVLYKVAYEEAAREIFMRTLSEDNTIVW